jgi:hypothetical protein
MNCFSSEIEVSKRGCITGQRLFHDFFNVVKYQYNNRADQEDDIGLPYRKITLGSRRRWIAPSI